MNSLACAILIQAVKDANGKRPNSDIESFIKSDWFSTLALTAGYTNSYINNIREKFLTGNYSYSSKLRRAYHRELSFINIEKIMRLTS